MPENMRDMLFACAAGPCPAAIFYTRGFFFHAAAGSCGLDPYRLRGYKILFSLQQHTHTFQGVTP
jgi:hypothetical protein